MLLVGKGVARCLASIAWIDGAEATDQSTRNGPLRDLIRGIPVRLVCHACDGNAVCLVATAVAQHGIQFSEIFGVIPRTILAQELNSIKQCAAANVRRPRQQRAFVVMLSQRYGTNGMRERTRVMNICRAGGTEVANFGVVGSLAVIDGRNKFRNQKVQIGITLTMRVSGHVYRHAGDVDGKIGSVVKVEAAQKILIGFTVSAVLRNDQARNIFEDFTRTQSRTGFYSSGSHSSLAGSVGGTNSGLVSSEHLHLWGSDIDCCSSFKHARARGECNCHCVRP